MRKTTITTITGAKFYFYRPDIIDIVVVASELYEKYEHNVETGSDFRRDTIIYRSMSRPFESIETNHELNPSFRLFKPKRIETTLLCDATRVEEMK